MVVVEKGYHANGRERIRPFPCFPNHRIAGTIAHGMTEYLTGPNAFLSLVPLVNVNGTRKFLKNGEKLRAGRRYFAANL